MTPVFCFAVLIAAPLLLVRGWPTGAPPDACAALQPMHNASAQHSDSPYHIVLGANVYTPGQTLKVTLTGPDYKGFMLQARRVNDNKVVGKFLPPTPPENRFQIRECNVTIGGNYVTHTHNNTKTGLVFQWQAPSTDEGPVVIRGSVVRTKPVWWGVLNSTVITFAPIHVKSTFEEKRAVESLL